VGFLLKQCLDLYYVLETPRHLTNPILDFVNSLKTVSVTNLGYINSFTMAKSRNSWSYSKGYIVNLQVDSEGAHFDRHLVKIETDVSSFPEKYQKTARIFRLYMVLLILRLFSVPEECFTVGEINSVKEISWDFLNKLSKEGRNSNHMFSDEPTREEIEPKHLAAVFNDRLFLKFLEEYHDTPKLFYVYSWGPVGRKSYSQTHLFKCMLEFEKTVNRSRSLVYPVIPVTDEPWFPTEDDVKAEQERVKDDSNPRPTPQVVEEEDWDEDEDYEHDDWVEYEEVPDDWDGDYPVEDCYCGYCEDLREQIREFQNQKGE